MGKKEHGFVGKHYLMKQAFGQEELHLRENVCTREEPPGCSSFCPLHLDMRAVCAYAAQGNFAKAAGVMRAATPFLHLLAGSCKGECVRKCTLARIGEGIRLPVLEKACALYGGSGAVNRFMIPRKNKKLAVAGDGLFALACCWELGKKGYEVIWHTSRDSEKEPLLDWKLSEEEAAADLTALSGFRISRSRTESFTEEQIFQWAKSADAVCVSPELGVGRLPDNGFTASLQEEAVWILASAKHASLLADHFLQGVSAEEREEPTVFESRLYVTMDGVRGSAALAGMEDLTRESASAEAARCIQCECRECIKGCVYLQHYKRNPRAAIREIYNNLSIVMGNHMANGMINACDECGQCRAACPNGFDYPDVCQIARHTMVETKKMPPSTHEFALLDQQFSNGEAFLARPQPGYEACRYLFFPGCQAAAVAPEVVRAAYRDLCGRLEGGVALMLGCCGAISRWAARGDLLAEAMEQLTRAWQELGEPRVICACPTCKKTFDELTQIPTEGIWETLLRLGVKPIEERTVTLHDACGARGDRKMQEDVRAFVRMLGCRVEEAAYAKDIAPCCGYGGLVKYANPEVSAKKAAFAAGQTEYPAVTYCMACRDQFARAGAKSYHILELAYGVDPAPVPDISMRRANRLRLREQLLKEIWKEDAKMEEGLTVAYQDGVEELLDARMILKSDIQAVLKAYRESGEAVLDEENGWLVTSCRIGNVTFWVKFTEEADGYLVHGAYSHRMTVE